MSGGVSLMQRQGGEPRYLPTILADKTSGVVAAQAITAALLARSRHGRGVHVEVPMYETMVAFTLLEHWYGRFFEEHAAQSGYPRALDPSRRPYATRDGYVCVMPYNDRHWREFWTSAGRTDLADDPRFQTISGRTSNISELYRLLEATLAQGTTEEWLVLCSRLEIPACKVFDVVDIVDDEHLNAVGFFREMDHPSEGRLRMMASPVLFDSQRPRLSPAPRLGQHNAEYISAGFKQSCFGSAACHQEPEHQAMAKTVTEGRLPGERK